MMLNIYSLTYDDLCEKLAEMGEKRSRADVIMPCVYSREFTGFEQTGLNSPLIQRLGKTFSCDLPECADRKCSQQADKFLFRLRDGNMIETVLMKHKYGNNVCVSTQVGCDMGCAFCVSGTLGRVRDLTADEMTGQLMYIKRSGEDISGIAVMGIGEPLLNLDALLSFIDIASYQKGLDIGVRHITVSTCGIVPGIYALADSGRRVNLAVSLHAPDDELRSRLMPVNRRYPVCDVIKAAKYYSEKLRRRVTLEYVMLGGVNDSTEHAQKLCALIGDSRLYVNIIRCNEGTGLFTQSSHEQIMKFYDVLKKNGIGVTMRMSVGRDVGGACGQLRAEKMNYPPL